ncbi:MAG TPA: hypothetical protein VNA14_10750, partial [Mycobacteriales bacterium]|nr:hypothetical protein [Mycobacteriales bacterium]
MDERFPGSAEPEAPPPYLGGGGAGAGQMSDRMQSMLARAAEEQMAEQRQLQVLVNDVRSSLAQLQQDVKLNAAATTVEVLRGEVSALGAEIRTSGTQLGERLEAVVRAVTASVQAVQSVGSQLEGITGQLADSHGVLVELPSTVQRAVSADTAVPAEVAALRAELTALRAEVAQLRASTADVVRGEVAQLRDETRATTASLSQTLTEHRDATRLEVQSARNAVEDSSRRLSSHVDEAVLALAEAMLRRRPTSGAPAAPIAPAAAVGLPAVEPDEAAEAAVDDTTPAVETPAIAEDSPRVGVTSSAAPRLAAAPPPPSVAEPVAGEPDEAHTEVAGDDLAHAPVDDVDPDASADAVGGTDEPDDVAAEVGLVEDEIDEPGTAMTTLSALGLTDEDAELEAEPVDDAETDDEADDADDDADADAEPDAEPDEVDPLDEADDEPAAIFSPPPPPPPPPGPSGEADEESPVGWFGGEDRPQSAFTLQDGWDRAARKERAPDSPDDEVDGESAE